MSTIHNLSAAELKLAEIIWASNSIYVLDLIRIAGEQHGWKRTTIYTMLGRMSEKGVVVNERMMVSALITRDEFFAGQSRNFVDDTFGGSLPMFVAAFMGGRKLNAQQALELRRLIDEHEGSGSDD